MAAYYEINKKKVSSPRSKEKKKPSPQSPHPNMDMTNEGEEEVYSVLEKALGLEVQKKPSPPSSRPLLPPPPPNMTEAACMESTPRLR